MKEGRVQTWVMRSPSGHQDCLRLLKIGKIPKALWAALSLWHTLFGTQPSLERKLLPQLAAAMQRQHHNDEVYSWHTQHQCKKHTCPGLLQCSTDPAMSQYAQSHPLNHLVSSILWEEAAHGPPLQSATPSALFKRPCFESHSPAFAIPRKGGGTWAVRRLAGWLFSFFLLCTFFYLPCLRPEPWVRLKLDYDGALQTPPKSFFPKSRPPEKRPTWLKLHTLTLKF